MVRVLRPGLRDDASRSSIVVWVEQGGFGAVAAAPVAREMLSQWFYGTPGPYVAGSSQTL